jgi:hypothetical protein
MALSEAVQIEEIWAAANELLELVHEYLMCETRLRYDPR